MANTHHVSIPDFDPATDSLTIDVHGTTYTFVADMALLHRISEDGLLPDEEERGKPEDVYKLLHLGLKARHPDLTEDEIAGWFPSMRAFMAVNLALVEYINDVVGDTGITTGGADGQGEGEAGSTSGRGRGTTSKSRRRK